MAINDETLRLTEELRQRLLGIVDVETRTLVAAWARAWDDVAGDLDRALLDLAAGADQRVSRAAVLRSQRLQESLATIGVRLAELAEQAGVTIIGDLPAIVRDAADTQAALAASQLPDGQVGVTFSRADADTLEAIVRRSTGQVVSRVRPLAPDADRAMRRELVRGVAVGANPRETARRMLVRAEGHFNGGLTRALVIARTETLDAHRAGAAAGQAAQGDVLAGWTWMASLSPRTCPACLAMHGRRYPLTEPGPLGHPQCRCARVPVTRSWRDLGFDLDEPPSLMQDGPSWFEGQPEAVQRSILGARGYAAWARGDWPVERWAVRRENPEWRPSYQVGKPRTRGRVAA